MIREAAYMLATVRAESSSFQPVKEKRASPTRQPKLYRTQSRYWGTGFYGRGFVQLTHKDKYQKAGRHLAGMSITLNNNPLIINSTTFVNKPDLVLQPEIAYLILSRGMREGWFRKRKNGTPYKLSDFIKEGQPPDYLNARNIINAPSDRAGEIAGYADKFELALRASRI
ncbi:MAG TPA: hypothetical protein VF596_18360 [Pyrinomonadaceae bacterium]